MAEPRKGRQTPTQSVVLPYFKTKGQDAIDLYVERPSKNGVSFNGEVRGFTADEQEWINNVLGVIDYDKRKRSEEYSWPDSD